MKVVVIGAGPAGTTAGYQLARGGASVDLFEAGAAVGGMARTLELWGQRVDLGPHRFFSGDARVNRLWLEMVGDDYEMVERFTRIYYRGRFFRYPLEAWNALSNLGLVEAARCVLSYASQRVAPAADEGSFEDWVVRRFGRRLFEIFFKIYSEKLWGIRCQDLDADFAAQRIRKLSLFEAVRNAILQGRGNTHRTLADRFAYPRRGAGIVYERMAGRIGDLGGTVHLGRAVERVQVEDGRAVGAVLAGGEERRFDHIVSSMPLTSLVERLPAVPLEVRSAAAALTFRNTILVYLRIDSVGLFPDQWLYIHSGELRVGRITNFRNWAPDLYGDEGSTILALEYWCNDADDLWAWPDERLVALASSELRGLGLPANPPVGAGHVVRLPRCYPAYRKGYRQHLSRVERYLAGIGGLSVIGRAGAFKYNNQDHSILMGMLAAENVLSGSALHDLWSVNTDYDSYQEEGAMHRTGLLGDAAGEKRA